MSRVKMVQRARKIRQAIKNDGRTWPALKDPSPMVRAICRFVKERTERLEREIAEQQEIQRNNPPSSEAWRKASAELHRLVEELTGKPVKEARGRS